MQFKKIHPKWIAPVKGSSDAAAFDLFMPEGGFVFADASGGVPVPLGFAAAVPEGHVALMFPRSGVGAKSGLALNNTCGVIDSDYRGEWVACLRVHNEGNFEWKEGDRLLQVLIVPVMSPSIQVVDELPATQRGAGGFGSTGK